MGFTPPLSSFERFDYMIRISKDEATAVRKKFGRRVRVYRTCQQKSQRHNYYATEAEFVQQFIADFREDREAAMHKWYDARSGWWL